MSSTTQLRLKVRRAAREVKPVVRRRIVAASWRVLRGWIPVESAKRVFRRVWPICIDCYGAAALECVEVQIAFNRSERSESAAITSTEIRCEGIRKGGSGGVSVCVR